jgi:hypothetical protein
LLLTILLAIVVHDAIAKYNRHDGSIYSCNEINAERAYAKNTKQPQKAQRLAEELKKYCPNYDNE